MAKAGTLEAILDELKSLNCLVQEYQSDAEAGVASDTKIGTPWLKCLMQPETADFSASTIFRYNS